MIGAQGLVVHSIVEEKNRAVQVSKLENAAAHCVDHKVCPYR